MFNIKREDYIVEEPFRVVEWGDAQGLTECNKCIFPGSLLVMETYKNGRIKKLWIDGVRYGEYHLETTKTEILKKCRML